MFDVWYGHFQRFSRPTKSDLGEYLRILGDKSKNM